MKTTFLFLILSLSINAHQVTFEPAALAHANLLSGLALDSNGHWGYRNATQRIVNQVLIVTPNTIKRDTMRVMKEGGEIIGFFGLRKNKCNELSFLFLKQNRIGKGYGKLLFHEAVRVAKEELGWHAMMWESDPFAAPFYRKMGAKEIGSNICPLNRSYQSPIFVLTFENI